MNEVGSIHSSWKRVLVLGAVLLAAPQVEAQLRVVRFKEAPLSETAGIAWKEIATEASGDVKSARLPDATSLSVHYEPGTDVVWFRIGLKDAPPPDWLGLNIAVDSDQDQSNGMAWWGTNKEFHFDRLVTAWLFRIPDGYEGTAGFTDAEGAKAGDLMKLGTDGLRLVVDRDGRAFLVGVDRKRLDEDRNMNLIVTVGSPFIANDDLPQEGSVRVEL